MLKEVWMFCAATVLVISASGCSKSAGPAVVPKSAMSTTASMAMPAILLETQPSDARPVAVVRTSAKDADEVTILGRIGGAEDPWVEGRAAFTIVDPKLEPCQPDEGCPTPWDYCCSTDQLPTHRVLIKVVDGSGSVVEQDARKFLGLKELQTIVARGKAKRDDAGNVTVLATGIYVVPDKK